MTAIAPRVQRRMCRVVDDLEHVLHDLDLVCRDIGGLVADIDRVTAEVEAATGINLEALEVLEATSPKAPLPLIRVNYASETEEDEEEATTGEFHDDELFEVTSTHSSVSMETGVQSTESLHLNLNLNTWSSFTVAFTVPEEEDFMDDDAFDNSENLTAFDSGHPRSETSEGDDPNPNLKLDTLDRVPSLDRASPETPSTTPILDRTRSTSPRLGDANGGPDRTPGLPASV